MKIVQHPAFPDLRQAVEDDAVESWTAQGWELKGDAPEAPLPAGAQIPCPVCGAVGDDPCVTKTGKPTDRHAHRTA